MHSRRSLLAAALGAVFPLAGCVTPARPSSAAGPAVQDSAALAARLDRVSWGVNDALLGRATGLGFDAWLDEQLGGRAAALDAGTAALIAAMSITQEPMEAIALRLEAQRRAADAAGDDAQKLAARQAYQRELERLAHEAFSRHVLRAMYSPDQVREQMTWFWMNHFSVHQAKHNLRAMLGDYEETVRTHSMGRFRALLGAVAHHPAMLRYLDNEQNAAGRINENYARELMELHTLGVDGGYTQSDVQELARVLTGVGVNLTGEARPVRRELRADAVRRGLFEFHPGRHDYGRKELLGRPITARGLAELDEALDRLASHPSTARFIARKLAMFWMDDTPSESVVRALAQRFGQTGGDMAQVLRTLFLQPGFWEARKFKDPMRFTLSALRAVQGDRPIPDTQPVLGWLRRMGEPLYGRQTPDGYPLESFAWTSAGQMAVRFEVARAIGSGNAAPALADTASVQARLPAFGPGTRAALSQARSPREWNALLLSSPDFMQR